MHPNEHPRLTSRDGTPVLFEGVKVEGDLRGLLFEASVEQRYRNSGDQPVELVYTFPLPAGAVLLGVDVLLGGERLSGTVVERHRAEAVYVEAISEGDAIMLEFNHDGSHTLNLGNLAPAEACAITLRYAQTLRFEQRGLRLLVPTVIAPRYGNPLTDGGLQPHQVPVHSLMAEHPFDIELRLHDDLARARVASPSHPIRVATTGTASDNLLTVSLARQGALDRDFVLVADQLAHDSLALAAPDSVDPQATAVLASFCPRVPADGPATVAVKLLVDCSGSMAGDSIAAAQRALQSIVRQMTSRDRFSLSRFGSTTEHRSRGLWSATDATRSAAQRWVAGLAADLGGTEMEAALASTFALAQTVSSDVLLVTDGQIEAIDRTIEAAGRSGHRVFVVGIGSSPAESHLRHLAEASGGACDFVAPGEAVEPAVLRMFARLRSPRLTDFRLVWPGEAVPQWVSALRGSVFDGDTLNVFGLLGHLPAGELRLLGARTPGGVPEVIGTATLTRMPAADHNLPRIAAWQRLQEISDPHALNNPGPEHVRLAIDYQLVTKGTSFLLVHERAAEEKAGDMPALFKIRQMLPAGWAGMGSIDGRIMQDVMAMRLEACASFAPERDERPAMALFEAPSVYDAVDNCEMQADAFDRSVPGHWRRSGSHAGLSPLGLQQWLLLAPARSHPASYEELRAAGVGNGVVDWLELVMASQEGETLDEGTVVASFLSVVASLALVTPAATGGHGEPAKRGAAHFLSVGADAGGAVTSLRNRLLEVLAQSAPDAWPDSVFALDSATAG